MKNSSIKSPARWRGKALVRRQYKQYGKRQQRGPAKRRAFT